MKKLKKVNAVNIDYKEDNIDILETNKAVGEKGAALSASSVNPFIGQVIRISVFLKGGIKPSRIEWHKNGGAVLEHEHNRYIELLNPTAGARYKCVVFDEDGTQYETDECRVMTAIPSPSKCEKLYNVRFHTHRLVGITSSHWHIVDEIDRILATTEEDSTLLQTLYSAITNPDNPKPQLYTMYSALLSCGRLLVQDTKDGYYTFYTQKHNKNSKSKIGRMKNFWK